MEKDRTTLPSFFLPAPAAPLSSRTPRKTYVLRRRRWGADGGSPAQAGAGGEVPRGVSVGSGGRGRARPQEVPQPQVHGRPTSGRRLAWWVWVPRAWAGSRGHQRRPVQPAAARQRRAPMRPGSAGDVLSEEQV